jgi:RecA/RadA recombinase
MSSVLEKLKKNCRIKEADVLADSDFYAEKDITSTSVPMVNVALSGSIDGGLTSGLTVLAGPSKHFKTSFALLMAGAYLKKHKDACLMFYDSEFGSPQQYFESFGIDTNRVLHIPIKNIEELKFDIVNQLEQMERKDKVIIVIDSVGNLASKKELEDAMNEKSVADMTRAKALKGLFRMVTPYLTMKNICLLAINHTYLEIGLFPKSIVSGGCVAAGTLITLPDGTTKAVEDFIEGDTVQTLDGPKKVTAVWNPDTLEDGEPECYEVTFEDGHTVVCSDKHKFLIDDLWVEAKDLVIGQDCKVVA